MPYHKLLSVRYSLLIVIGAALVIAGCSDQQALTGPENNTGPQLSHSPGPSNHPVDQPGIQGLTAVENATEEYKDLSKAEADGYTLFSPFVPGMGFHYLTSDAIGTSGNSTLDRSLNRTKPEILVYADNSANSTNLPNIDNNEALGAVEYAIPKKDGETTPPQHAVALFNNADEEDWHVHPSVHELGLDHSTWTAHGECHYENGAGIVLLEKSDGTLRGFVPAPGSSPFLLSTWDGPPVTASDCPDPDRTFGSDLLIAHGKWWTLHAWIWLNNPEGTFHATNPRATL